jgi:hypothetical protein
MVVEEEEKRDEEEGSAGFYGRGALAQWRHVTPVPDSESVCALDACVGRYEQMCRDEEVTYK